ncbi:hypothetical protein M0802_001570 [Mischocyttarus mexicanus]|nr:hypothetical protein M0802_001570 [Mischocyttarus mexicanus]
MSSKEIIKECSSQETLTSMCQREGYSKQECNHNNNFKIVVRRKRVYKVSNKKKVPSKSKCRKIKKRFNVSKIGPLEYVFYSILNTSCNMDRGTATAAIARGLIALHKRLNSNSVMTYYLIKWRQSGEKIVILEGINNKHLNYLYNETKYFALDLHKLYEQWSNRKDIIVLTVFGMQEDLQDTFEGLLPLQ